MSTYRKTRKDGSHAWYVDVSHRGKRYRFIAGATRMQAPLLETKLRDKLICETFVRDHLFNNP